MRGVEIRGGAVDGYSTSRYPLEMPWRAGFVRWFEVVMCRAGRNPVGVGESFGRFPGVGVRSSRQPRAIDETPLG